MNALAKAGIELEENEPDIEEARRKAGWPTGASEAWVLVWIRTLHAAIVLQRHGHAMGMCTLGNR